MRRYCLDAEKIKRLCVARGWNAWDLARASGVEHIRRIVDYGENRVLRDTAEDIAAALGVRLDEIVVEVLSRREPWDFGGSGGEECARSAASSS